MLADGIPTVCTFHREDLPDDAIFYARACAQEGCREPSRWGAPNEQPTHCPKHGRGKPEFVSVSRRKGGKARLTVPFLQTTYR
ncbi:unnamed protein product [Ectocarpus fasciculatus]